MFCSQYSRKFKEERSSGIFKSFPFSSDRESLAREASNEAVEVWEFVCIDFGNVSIWLVIREVGLVDLSGVFVDFGETNTTRGRFP